MNPTDFLKRLMHETKNAVLLFSLLFVFFVLPASAGNPITLINGNLYTSANASLWSGTNSAGTITNNYQLGTVPGASNVLFYLSPNFGALPAPIPLTNNYPPVLPTEVFNPQGGYPTTLYGPYANSYEFLQCSLTATNASSTTITFRFAGSPDGFIWYTNLYVQTYIVPINSLSPLIPVAYSNNVFRVPYVAVQEIDNPGVAAVTNIQITVGGAPGL